MSADMEPRRHDTTKTRLGLVWCLRAFVAGVIVSCVAPTLAPAIRTSHDERATSDRPSGNQRPATSNQSGADRGREIYMRVGCYQCHGREAQGASTGPRL